MALHELFGVADLMRCETLFREGGITLDADSIFIRHLGNWFLEANEFTAWKNEYLINGGLLGVGIVNSVKESLFFKQIIQIIFSEQMVINDDSWKVTEYL